MVFLLLYWLGTKLVEFELLFFWFKRSYCSGVTSVGVACNEAVLLGFKTSYCSGFAEVAKVVNVEGIGL